MSRTRAKHGNNNNALLYGIAALLFIVAGVLLFARRAQAGEHPKPRSEAAELATMNPDDFGDYVEVKETYKMAAQIKTTLDGLYCYCHCKGGGHYSLLDCFRDEHGAGCDICLGEAQLAYKMKQEGKSLSEIRAAVDAQFGA